MTESNQAEESIEYSIRKNGFPQKIVRLPFKAVYDACKNHGTNLSDVLDNLQERQIFGKIIGNHVEFRAREKIELTPPESSSADEFSWIKGAASNLKGFQTRPAWTLLHKLKHFQKCSKSDLSVSINLFNRIISLPSSPNIIKN